MGVTFLSGLQTFCFKFFLTFFTTMVVTSNKIILTISKHCYSIYHKQIKIVQKFLDPNRSWFVLNIWIARGGNWGVEPQLFSWPPAVRLCTGVCSYRQCTCCTVTTILNGLQQPKNTWDRQTETNTIKWEYHILHSVQAIKSANVLRSKSRPAAK